MFQYNIRLLPLTVELADNSTKVGNFKTLTATINRAGSAFCFSRVVLVEAPRPVYVRIILSDMSYVIVYVLYVFTAHTSG